MSVTVKAIFENGNVKLQEPAPTNEKVPVTVIFPDESNSAEILLKKNEIKFGSFAGKISTPENFDDELDDWKEYR